LASRFKRSFSDRDNEVRSTSKGGIHYDALDEAGNRQSRFIKEEKNLISISENKEKLLVVIPKIWQ